MKEGVRLPEEAYWGISLFSLAVLLGFFIERYLFFLLVRLAGRTKWAADDILLAVFQRRVGFWSLLLAGYFFAHYFVKEAGALSVIREAALAAFILSLARALSESATALIGVYAKQKPRIIPSTSIFINLTNSVLFILAAIFALQALGISITPLLTALGVGGLAVALALQDTLSNFFAGLHLLIARPIRPWDYIRLDSGEEGYVADITWRNTAIEDLMKNMIIVPNSKMTEAKIVNYNLPEKQMLITVPLAVDYQSDLEQVERVVWEAAKTAMERVNDTAATMEPMVRFCGFGDNSVELKVSLCVRQFSSQYYIRHEFMKLLQRRFLREGIALPESTHVVWLKNGRSPR